MYLNNVLLHLISRRNRYEWIEWKFCVLLLDAVYSFSINCYRRVYLCTPICHCLSVTINFRTFGFLSRNFNGNPWLLSRTIYQSQIVSLRCVYILEEEEEEKRQRKKWVHLKCSNWKISQTTKVFFSIEFYNLLSVVFCHRCTKCEINWIIKRSKLITVWRWCERANQQTIKRANKRASERNWQTNGTACRQVYRMNVNKWASERAINQQPELCNSFANETENDLKRDTIKYK